MKKLIATLLPGISFLLAASPTLAVQPIQFNACPSGTAFGALCLSATDLPRIVQNAINLLFVGAALLALVFLVMGGVKWLTSQGEKEGINKARETIVASIVGLIIIFLSYLIVNFILNLFVGTNLFNLRLPTITGQQ